jgi:hypothetical protein
MCCWFKCEHEYATIPSVNIALMIEPNRKFLCKKIKLFFHDENYSKFIIFLTLGLKVTKSPSRNFTHQKLSNSIMNFPEFIFIIIIIIIKDF